MKLMKKAGLPASRLMVLAVCILFLVGCLAGFAFLTVHDDHHCADEHCAVCLHIETARKTLRLLQNAALAAVAVGLFLCAGRLPAADVARGSAAVTPVLLKVRMDH